MMNMYDAKEIAKYILLVCNQNNIFVTVSKLCKILYYIQGIMLTRFNKPLFKNDIVAWKYGPCIPDVHYKYAYYGAENIHIPDELLLNTLKLNVEEKKLIAYVLINTKDMDFCQMIKHTTRNNSPWSKVELNDIITHDLIKQHFTWF